MAATWDSTAYGETGANATFGVSVTIAAGHTNLVLAALIFLIDTGAVTVSSISGAGATWTKCGSGAGNGTMRGEIWQGIAPNVTGAQTITVNLSAAVSNNAGAEIFSTYSVDQTTPLSGAVFTISGNNVITVASGDLAVSAQFDTNNNRTVSGCTSSTDNSAFSSVGHAAAHCTGSPTSTFTWSGFSGTSMAMGVDVKQVSAGGGRGLFRTPVLSGVGIGGSFFRDPLQGASQ